MTLPSLTLFSPSGVLARALPLQRAARRLRAHGFEVTVDEAARARHQRFAGDDDTRLQALHRVADQAPDVALATRGGYGLTRLLDRIDWPRIVRSVERGTRWVGHSDMTAFQLGLLAHGKGSVGTWAGPLACSDFGGEAVDDITEGCFLEAMSGQLEAIGFAEGRARAPQRPFDGLSARGTLWGGNLCMLTSLLGTPHWPARRVVQGGILFLEDVNEHPYRIERSLLQLQQAGVLDSQKAVLLGDFTEFKKSPLDGGYNLAGVVEHLRSLTRTPILTGLPFGHGPTKVCLPVGVKVQLLVQGRDVLLGWEHSHSHDHDHGLHCHGDDCAHASH
jgi:muramoyltetrapeptide carboxypeptidase